MKRRDFFKRLGAGSAVLAAPALVIAAAAVQKPEEVPDDPKKVKMNAGHYTSIKTVKGQKYKMSYFCKIHPDYIDVDQISVHQIEKIEDHIMKGIGVIKVNGF